MGGSGEDAAPTVVLRLPASPAHVRTARLVAAAMARRSGVDEGLLDEVRLAVGEACARAVRQHERYGVHEPVTVEFGDRGSFSVAVIDRAPSAGGDRQPAAARSGLVAGESAEAGDGDLAEVSLMPSLDPTVGRPPGVAVADVPDIGGQARRRPDLAAPWRGLNATADSLGLALLGAVVQDLAVTPAAAGAGTRVAMSWPLEG
jgi:anti-sigma regulatory factor (Ser/Thr protein kinase)